MTARTILSAILPSWAIFFVFAFRTILLAVAHVLLVDAEFRSGIVHADSRTGELRFVADYLAAQFVFAFAAVGYAVAFPRFL